MRMRRMGLDIRLIGFDQLWSIFNDQEVLGIALLSRLREIERPGENRRAVDHHHLVMRNGVLIINEGRNARVDEERGRAVPLQRHF